MIQLFKAELARANALRAEARDERAKAALEGVILALRWAIEDGPNAEPAEAAARLRVEKAESEAEKPAPPRKRKRK